MPRQDEKILVSLKGSPVAQYHQDIIIWVRSVKKIGNK